MNDEIIETVGIVTNTIKYPLDFQEETDRESRNKNIRLIVMSTTLYVKEVTNDVADDSEDRATRAEDDGLDDGAEDDGLDDGAEDDILDDGAEDDILDDGTEDDGLDDGAEDDILDDGAEDDGADEGAETETSQYAPFENPLHTVQYG